MLEGSARGILLDEDEVGFKRLNLLHDDLHERLLLVNLGLHVDWTIIILNIAEVAIDDKDLGHFNLSAHSSTGNVLFENHAVYILAFLLVRVLDCHYLDKRVEID